MVIQATCNGQHWGAGRHTSSSTSTLILVGAVRTIAKSAHAPPCAGITARSNKKHVNIGDYAIPATCLTLICCDMHASLVSRSLWNVSELTRQSAAAHHARSVNDCAARLALPLL